MTSKPPYGIHFPVELVHVRDGDTLVVRRRGSGDGGWRLPIRLLDCWAAERHTDDGKEAKAHLEHLIDGEEMSLFIPFEGIERSFLSILTFDRFLGYIYTSKGDLSELMVSAGQATKEKPTSGN